jgi:hypothetical protein
MNELKFGLKKVFLKKTGKVLFEIGRASCRDRV